MDKHFLVKVGIALVSAKHLVLYRNSKEKIAVAAVDAAFDFSVRGNDNYVSFVDNGGKTWSVRFGGGGGGGRHQLEEMAKRVAMAKFAQRRDAVTVQDLGGGKTVI